MFLAILIGQFILPIFVHADEVDIGAIMRQRAIGASSPFVSDDKHDNGYESPNAPKSTEDMIDDIYQAKAEEIKYCTELQKAIVVKHCKEALQLTQAYLASSKPEDFPKYKRAAALCNRKCGGKIPSMPDCQNGMKKAAQEEIKSYMADKKCNATVDNTDAETAVGVKKSQIEIGDTSVKTVVSSVNDGDGYRTRATCFQSTVSTMEPGACEIREGVSTGSQGETKYVYTDNNGNQFATRQEAAASNQALFFGNGGFASGAIAEQPMVAVAPIPRARPQIVTGEATEKTTQGVVQKSGGSQAGDTGASAATTDPAASNLASSPAVTTNSNSAMNLNSGSTGTASSNYGDPVMFPGLQSAKASSRGSETTSSSGKSLGYASGSSQGSSSKYGGYNSFATGDTSKSSSGRGGDEVASSAPRGITVASVSGNGGSFSSGGGVGSNGLNSGTQTGSLRQASQASSGVGVPMGDQGFFKPGGSATGAGGQKINSYGTKQSKNHSKKLKSFGSCPPGNLQCVLAQIGSSGSTGTKKAHRSIASQTGRYQLPAGVTSGVEDIFSRVVKFHNNKIRLDHEGMIQSSDGGFSN